MGKFAKLRAVTSGNELFDRHRYDRAAGFGLARSPCRVKVMCLTNRLYSIDDNLIAARVTRAARTAILRDNWMSHVMCDLAHAVAGEVGV